MNYEKAYKEALERAKGIHSFSSDIAEIKRMEQIFPELAESEDERIMKELSKDIWNYIPYEKAQKYITWLKKQVEQKPILDVEIPFGAKDSELEEVSYSIPDGYHAEIEDNKIVIKKGEQKPTKVEPKFKVGDTMRTLQEASDGITDGMPVVVSIDNEYYHCTNELIAIKDQDDYEFPPINMKQKSADKVEPKFHEGDCIIHHGTNNIYQVVAIIDNQYQLKYGDTYVIQTCADIDRCARLFKPKFNVDDWVVNNTTHNVCRILKVEHGQYICDNCSFPINKENEYHLWTIKDAKDKMATYLSQTKLQTEQKPTDRAEPKFHEGEWAVSNLDKKARQISEVHFDEYNSYYVVDGKSVNLEEYDRLHHLWSIADAKDGDVLCYKDEISLYKHDIKNCTKQEITFGGFVYHCCYDGKRFITDSLYSLTEQDKIDIHPATNEQRELLFAKMREAGYEWNEEKKDIT